MRRLFALCCLVLNAFLSLSQAETVRVYAWNEVVNANADTVFGISFEKMRLTELPDGLRRFTHLKVLNVSKNRLTELPEYIAGFGSLELLDISKNEFLIFPLEICQLTRLTTLKANRNEFDLLPECFGNCSLLTFIDFWDTPIKSFPLSFYTMSALRYVDLQGVQYGPTFQEYLRKKMPWVKFKLDAPCNCME
jgi:Leucine-rich repeat (LRR) protein